MKRLSLRRAHFLVLAILCLAGAATCAAQSRGASITAGVHETTLPNGLKVITKEVHSAPVVSFSVWYRVGSRNEHTGITGTSHLLEHMMFKGTKKYGLGEISRTLFVNGASFNATTSYDRTNYYETLASDRLELAMQIESDRMTGSRIDDADLKSEMTVVRSELEGGENSNDELLYRAVAAAAFEAHPYQWPVIGWRTDVENVPREAIYEYYRTHYGPNNAAVVIVGDFDTPKALDMVRKYFGKIKPIKTPPPVYTQEPPQNGERRVRVARPGALPMAMIAWKGPDAKSPDFYALDLLSMILGNGRTSRLYQGLVEKQIASSADASDPTMKDPYLIYVNATARPGTSADQLEEALLAEVERVKTEPVTTEELARAKTQIEADFVYGNNSVTSQANQIGYWEIIDSWHYLDTYLDRIRAVTAADIQRVAQKYFVKETRTVGQFIPTAQTAGSAPPPREASARVEPPKRGDRPVPLPKPTAKFTPRNISRFKLDNGISVIVQENPSNPTFALRGSIPAGSVFDPQGKHGAASLTAAMLSRGTDRHSALEFASALAGIGASLGAGADDLTTTFSGMAQSKDFDTVMDLFAEMIRRPNFPAVQLQRLQGQVLAGVEEERDDPASLASRAFSRAVYPEGSPLRPETLDEAAQQIQGLARADLESFYRRQYGPDRMIIVISGDVKADHVRQALQSRFGDWARNPQAQPLPELKVPLQTRPVRDVIQVPDKSETAIMWGFAGGLTRHDPDFYATQVLNMVLGGGGALNSRLGTQVRDVQGLAYSIFSSFDSSLYPGPFTIQLGTNPANSEKAVTALLAEVNRIRDQGVTQREVDEAVAYLTGSFPVRLETNAGMANVLWVAEFYGLGNDYIEKYADYYRAVTVQQVNEAAKKHLHPETATLVIAGTVPNAGAPAPKQ